MCEQSSITYLDGDVVWVKLGNCWWPGEVCGESRQPEGLLSSVKKQPIAVVKFFQENTFEYVKSINNIYKYNCLKKNEFIRKGLDLYRANNKYMDKFPSDVTIAEQLTGGDPGILSKEEFAPFQKPNYASIFGDQSKKVNKKVKTPPRKSKTTSSPGGSSDRRSIITHPRFIKKAQDGISDHEVRILAQPATSSSDPSTPIPIRRSTSGSSCGTPVSTSPRTYKCHLCNFSSNRLNVIVLHTKNHKNESPPVTPKGKKSTTSQKTPLSLKKSTPRANKSNNLNKTNDDSIEIVAQQTSNSKQKDKSPIKMANKHKRKKTIANQIDDVATVDAAQIDIPDEDEAEEDDENYSVKLKDTKQPKKKPKTEPEISKLLADWSEEEEDEENLESIAQSASLVVDENVETDQKEITVDSPQEQQENNLIKSNSPTTDVDKQTQEQSAALDKNNSAPKYRNIPKKDRRDVVLKEFSNADILVNDGSGSKSEESTAEMVDTPVVESQLVSEVVLDATSSVEVTEVEIAEKEVAIAEKEVAIAEKEVAIVENVVVEEQKVEEETPIIEEPLMDVAAEITPLNSDDVSKTPDENDEKINQESVELISETPMTPSEKAIEPKPSISCFDFKEEDEDEDFLTSLSKLKKKYMSSDKSKEITEPKAKEADPKDDQLSADIENLLNSTKPPDMKSPDLNLPKRAPSISDTMEVKTLPIKERGKRIFKSRNRSRCDEGTSSAAADKTDIVGSSVTSSLCKTYSRTLSTSSTVALETRKSTESEKIVTEIDKRRSKSVSEGESKPVVQETPSSMVEMPLVVDKNSIKIKNHEKTAQGARKLRSQEGKKETIEQKMEVEEIQQTTDKENPSVDEKPTEKVANITELQATIEKIETESQSVDVIATPDDAVIITDKQHRTDAVGTIKTEVLESKSETIESASAFSDAEKSDDKISEVTLSNLLPNTEQSSEIKNEIEKNVTSKSEPDPIIEETVADSKLISTEPMLQNAKPFNPADEDMREIAEIAQSMQNLAAMQQISKVSESNDATELKESPENLPSTNRIAFDEKRKPYEEAVIKESKKNSELDAAETLISIPDTLRDMETAAISNISEGTAQKLITDDLATNNPVALNITDEVYDGGVDDEESPQFEPIKDPENVIAMQSSDEKGSLDDSKVKKLKENVEEEFKKPIFDETKEKPVPVAPVDIQTTDQKAEKIETPQQQTTEQFETPMIPSNNSSTPASVTPNLTESNGRKRRAHMKVTPRKRILQPPTKFEIKSHASESLQVFSPNKDETSIVAIDVREVKEGIRPAVQSPVEKTPTASDEQLDKIAAEDKSVSKDTNEISCIETAPSAVQKSTEATTPNKENIDKPPDFGNSVAALRAVRPRRGHLQQKSTESKSEQIEEPDSIKMVTSVSVTGPTPPPVEGVRQRRVRACAISPVYVEEDDLDNPKPMRRGAKKMKTFVENKNLNTVQGITKTDQNIPLSVSQETHLQALPGNASLQSKKLEKIGDKKISGAITIEVIEEKGSSKRQCRSNVIPQIEITKIITKDGQNKSQSMTPTEAAKQVMSIVSGEESKSDTNRMGKKRKKTIEDELTAFVIGKSNPNSVECISNTKDTSAMPSPEKISKIDSQSMLPNDNQNVSIPSGPSSTTENEAVFDISNLPIFLSNESVLTTENLDKMQMVIAEDSPSIMATESFAAGQPITIDDGGSTSAALASATVSTAQKKSSIRTKRTIKSNPQQQTVISQSVLIDGTPQQVVAYSQDEEPKQIGVDGKGNKFVIIKTGNKTKMIIQPDIPKTTGGAAIQQQPQQQPLQHNMQMHKQITLIPQSSPSPTSIQQTPQAGRIENGKNSKTNSPQTTTSTLFSQSSGTVMIPKNQLVQQSCQGNQLIITSKGAILSTNSPTTTTATTHSFSSTNKQIEVQSNQCIAVGTQTTHKTKAVKPITKTSDLPDSTREKIEEALIHLQQERQQQQQARKSASELQVPNVENPVIAGRQELIQMTHNDMQEMAKLGYIQDDGDRKILTAKGLKYFKQQRMRNTQQQQQQQQQQPHQPEKGQSEGVQVQPPPLTPIVDPHSVPQPTQKVATKKKIQSLAKDVKQTATASTPARSQQQAGGVAKSAGKPEMQNSSTAPTALTQESTSSSSLSSARQETLPAADQKFVVNELHAKYGDGNNLLAIPSESFGGPPNTFYLCTMSEDETNFVPLDHQPLILDASNQLVPVVRSEIEMAERSAFVEADSVPLSAIAGGVAAVEQECQLQLQVSPDDNEQILTDISQLSDSGNPQYLIQIGDGQQLLLDQQSLLALAASGSEGAQLVSPDGQQVLLPPELLSAISLSQSGELGGQILLSADGATNQDILAAALAGTDVYQQDQQQQQLIGDVLQIETNNGGVQLVEQGIAFQPINNQQVTAQTNVTNAILTQPPIMSTLEVPSNKKKSHLDHLVVSKSTNSETGLIEQNLDDSLALLPLVTTAVDSGATCETGLATPANRAAARCRGASNITTTTTTNYQTDNFNDVQNQSDSGTFDDPTR